MMRKLMIIDEQAQYTQFLRDHFGKFCEIIVCNRSSGIAELIAETKPDYMIMDFTSSAFEGFTLLRSAISLGANPAVIGIVQSSYYFTAMVQRVKNISSTISRPINHETMANRISLMMELSEDQLIPLPTRSQYVTFMLSSLNIHTEWLGGRNLIDVIPMAADNPDMSYTKELYLEAGKRSGHGVQNVERNIRTAIEKGFHQGNMEIWANYFPPDKTGTVLRPCNSDFISHLAIILKANRGQYRDDD